MSVQLPWYADIVNYLAYGIIPLDFSYQQKRKLRTDTRVYIWDDPLLFRRGTDQIIRRCVPEDEQGEIIDKCHASPYEGHFARDRTAQPRKFSNQVFTGLLYSEIVLNRLNIVKDVKEWAI